VDAALDLFYRLAERPRPASRSAPRCGNAR
jgi:hypothetical protein